MAEQPRNGYDPTRLDRIEGLVEVLVNEHILLAQEHREFAEEHKKLLIAQVVLTDRVDKLTAQSIESNERMNALISIVDGLVRKGPKLE